MAEEKDIQNNILRAYGTQRFIKIWRANTGVAQYGDRKVRFGVPGQADISGILSGIGRRIEIEVKSAKGRQSAQQKRYQAMIESHGGLYIIARSVRDVRNALRPYVASDMFSNRGESHDLASASNTQLINMLVVAIPAALRELVDDVEGRELIIRKLCEVAEEIHRRMEAS